MAPLLSAGNWGLEKYFLSPVSLGIVVCLPAHGSELGTSVLSLEPTHGEGWQCPAADGVGGIAVHARCLHQVLLVALDTVFILTSAFSFVFDCQGNTHTHTYTRAHCKSPCKEKS